MTLRRSQYWIAGALCLVIGAALSVCVHDPSTMVLLDVFAATAFVVYFGFTR
jgi:hypothetical protein